MKIESSNIGQAHYDSQKRSMFVQFHHGATYEFVNVPPEKWDGFLNAESKGSYLHNSIRPHHRSWPRKDYKWEGA